MSQYGNEFTNAVKLARDQLKNPPTTTPAGADTGNALDILLEALSGIPQSTMMSNLAGSINAGATGTIAPTVTTPPPVGGGGIGGGGKIIIEPQTITRNATEASAPIMNTQAVLDGAITPNVLFHMGATATVGLVSIIGELFSIGQIDKILEPLLSFLDLTDAPTIFQGVRNIRLRNQVLQPYEYYVNEQNPINIPSYADLIRLRVREDREGKPILKQAEFEQQMKYQGYAKWWSGALWDAHFTLPSNSELFEMYNTGLITNDQLRSQLVINDIAPEWVDRIAAIAKRYPTMPELRMMARRMPMDKAVVERALKAQGIKEEYFPFYVQLFTDWDVDAIRGRRQTRIVAAYEEGILSDAEFRNVIATTYASTRESEELLLEAQWRRYMRRMGERQKTVIKLLQKLRITRDEAEEVLAKLGFEPIDIDHWLDYATATMGLAPEIEHISEEGIAGLESEEARAIKFTEWEELTPPIFFPTYSEGPPPE